jgi:hypothetical protein
VTIEQFRQHKFLPAQWARELATNGILQSVMRLMEENHPARYALRADRDDDISPTRASIELGLTRGYSKYADTLRILAVPIPGGAEAIGPPTYEQPPK